MAAAGAVVIFAAILGVMSLLVQHPLRELQEKSARRPSEQDSGRAANGREEDTFGE